MKAAFIVTITTLLLAGCQHKTMVAASPDNALHCANTTSSFECDRKAILAMAGEYEVNFHFEETASLRAGYEKKHGHDSKAKEWVSVIEDHGTRIVLQHILLGDKGEVTKHWRQDWHYQPDIAWEFSGTQKAQQWRQLKLSNAQRQGAWLQTVWHVDDSPRYASIGRWQHLSNMSSWNGNTTQRPLPRREYSTRSDYDLLIANNRQEITPTGWVHWQDNLKWDSNADASQRAVAREIGINTFTRVGNSNFAPAKKYWDETREYWALVRDKWQQTFTQKQAFAVRDKIDAMTMWLTLSAAADETISDTTREKQAEIETIFARYIIDAEKAVEVPAIAVAALN